MDNTYKNKKYSYLCLFFKVVSHLDDLWHLLLLALKLFNKVLGVGKHTSVIFNTPYIGFFVVFVRVGISKHDTTSNESSKYSTSSFFLDQCFRKKLQMLWSGSCIELTQNIISMENLSSVYRFFFLQKVVSSQHFVLYVCTYVILLTF